MHTAPNINLRHPLSRHALLRMQQRSIPQYVVAFLTELTDPVDAGGGCTVHRFNQDSWAEARCLLGSHAPRLDRYRTAYVVLGPNGLVVTASRLH